LLVAVFVTVTAVATTASLFEASKRVLRDKQLEIETTQTARAAIDTIVRDLRLGGACLPVTGDFISLDGTNAGNDEDEITTRTGLTRPDLSCVKTSSNTPTVTLPDGTLEPQVTPKNGTTIAVASTEGFTAGMRAYIRGASTGDYFVITSVNTSANTLGRDRNFSQDYPDGSGVYAMDERRYYINHWEAPWGDTPELMMQIGEATPQSFAVGIEKLDIQYQLKRNCPPCDVVTAPTNEDDWRLAEQVLLSVTARSVRPGADGTYFRRTVTVGVKPRNLLPQ
jgi:hypothetical protein